MIALADHVAAALTAAQAQGETMTKHCNNHGATVADVSHLIADQVATVELSRIHGDAYPVTARTYEHAGALYLAGHAIRYRSGEPAPLLVRVIDPAPPTPAAAPAIRRSPDGQSYVVGVTNGPSCHQWRVTEGLWRGRMWLDDEDVANWTPMVITAEGEAPAPAPAARVITAVEIEDAAERVLQRVYPRIDGKGYAQPSISARMCRSYIRAVLAEFDIEFEGEQS